MKRRLISIIAICLVLVQSFILTGCGDNTPKTYVDTEETITVKVNQEFNIALDFDLIHLWREIYDESMLSLEEDSFDTSPKVQESETEYGVAQYFRFKALKKGETEITINKMSVDGKVVIEQKVFSVNIR